MAIADVIGKVFSAQIVMGVKQVTPYVAYAQDRSAEIQNNGDGLIIGLTDNLVSVSDYPASDGITYATLSPTKAELAIDKEKYIAFQLEDTDRAQIAFDLFGDATRQSVRELAGQVSADYRAALAAVNVANDHSFAVAFTNAGPTKAERVKAHLAVFDVTAALKTLGFEQRPILFVHPAFYRQLIEYATVETSVALPSISERAFADALLSPVYGADIIPDWGATNPTTLNGADCYAVIPGRTLVYGQQLSVPEQMRSQTRFATQYRALNTYGVGVQDTATLYKIDVSAA